MQEIDEADTIDDAVDDVFDARKVNELQYVTDHCESNYSVWSAMVSNGQQCKLLFK